MKLDDYENYELDIKATHISNIPVYVAALVGVIYIVYFNRTLNTFTLIEMKMIALFVFAYSAIRIIFGILNNINIEYKPRR